MGSNPSRNSRRIFFSGVNFLCWILLWYPFHPCVTTVACRKKFLSFCQKCRWLVTAKHACTLCIHVALHEMMWYGVWLYGVHRTCQDGYSFRWHQPYSNQTVLQLHHLGGYIKLRCKTKKQQSLSHSTVTQSLISQKQSETTRDVPAWHHTHWIIFIMIQNTKYRIFIVCE